MRLRDILAPEAVCGSLSATDKKGVIEELAGLAARVNSQLDQNQVLRVLLEREKLGSTGVGNGVAIPHGKISGLDSIIVFFARSKKGIEFHLGVTHHTRVWCSPLKIFSNKIINNLPIKRLFGIYYIKWNADRLSNSPSVFHVLQRTTSP